MSLVLNPTLKQSPTPSLTESIGSASFSFIFLPLIPSQKLISYYSCITSAWKPQLGDISVYHSLPVWWQVREYLSANAFSKIPTFFLFFFNRVVSPLRRKTVLCDVAPPMWRC